MSKSRNIGNGRYVMKDSGSRERFVAGAVRDVREGKGRYDLISPIALHRVALVYEKGAIKYSPRNWEKGIPLTRFFDSCVRHLYQHIEGQRDEDHLAHALWNVIGMIHTEECVKRGLLPQELLDWPMYIPQEKKRKSQRPSKAETALAEVKQTREDIRKRLEAIDLLMKLNNAVDKHPLPKKIKVGGKTFRIK